MTHTAEEHKEPDVHDITTWETVKEIQPLLQSQHSFAQSSAGSKDRMYYLKKYTTIMSSIMFLLLVGMGTFLISWNRPTTNDMTTAPNEETIPEVVLPTGSTTMTTTASTTIATTASINAFFSDSSVTAPTQMPAISEYHGYVAPPVVIGK